MAKALLEVIALDATDARSAVDGGADRLELVSSMQFSGFNPSLDAFGSIRSAVNVPLRVMIRLRDGFLTGGSGAVSALATSVKQLREAGADEFVMGWLDANGAVDWRRCKPCSMRSGAACRGLSTRRGQAGGPGRVFEAIRGLPGLDTVLTSGGPFPAAQGMRPWQRRPPVKPRRRTA